MFAIGVALTTVRLPYLVLEPGDTIRVLYGAPEEKGGGLAYADPYAEKGQEFRCASRTS